MNERFDIVKVLRGKLVALVNERTAQAVKHVSKHKEITGLRKVVLEISVFADQSGDVCVQGDVKIALPGVRDSERFVIAKQIIEQNGQLVFPAAKDPKVQKPANKKEKDAS